MKTSITLIISLIVSLNIFAGTINAINSGNWNSNSTWDLGRLPIAGDIVSIPSGKTVMIVNLQNYAGSLNIDIYGNLILNGGSIYLGNSSIIYIYSLGKVQGMGNNTELIKIGGVQKYSGNSQTPVFGPQMASAATGNGFSPFIALPVKFTNFTVNYLNHSALIKWSTSEELNAKDFTIEKSIDGNNWNTIGVVKANGNTNYTSDYSFTDNNINSPVNYYRIKETDITGELTYTSIKSIKTDLQSQLNINISSMGNSKILLQFSSEVKGVIAINYISLSGQILAKQEIKNPATQQILANTSLHGNYFISITTEQGQHLTKQIIL